MLVVEEAYWRGGWHWHYQVGRGVQGHYDRHPRALSSGVDGKTHTYYPTLGTGGNDSGT